MPDNKALKKLICDYAKQFEADMIGFGPVERFAGTNVLDIYPDTKTVICIINKCQITALYEILKKYPGTFAVMDPVSEVLGNFKQISKDGKESIKMLDDGKDKSF